MLTLINTNRMTPPIAPIGLDYVAAAARRSGVEVELVDLGMTARPDAELDRYFAARQPELVGLTLRNVDDCFWPGAQWFLPELCQIVQRLRTLTDAPIVLGGVGFSIFAERIVELSGVEFGIRGDGEQAVVALVDALGCRRDFADVPGLVWRDQGRLRANRPAWPDVLDMPGGRDMVDNAAYFRLGGQIGLETKRGCPRRCAYCADPVAKGPRSRLRDPAAVADEVESLLAQGIDMLHLCDAEFNLPPEHAMAVCDALIDRRLGRRMRWYAYLAVVPFDAALAERMARAGCVGINFTSDAASATMLGVYRQPHRADDLARAVRLCRAAGIAVMLDMLLGGPGETPDTAAESISTFKQIDPDCAGAGLGVRLYPDTEIPRLIAAQGPLETHPGVRRHYAGPIDLVRPTFYISPALGPHPAHLVRELIGGDPRFFPPEDDQPQAAGQSKDDHNYNDNQVLVDAIRDGQRGAYWDILRRRRA